MFPEMVRLQLLQGWQGDSGLLGNGDLIVLILLPQALDGRRCLSGESAYQDSVGAGLFVRGERPVHGLGRMFQCDQGAGVIEQGPLFSYWQVLDHFLQGRPVSGIVSVGPSRQGVGLFCFGLTAPLTQQHHRQQAACQKRADEHTDQQAQPLVVDSVSA